MEIFRALGVLAEPPSAEGGGLAALLDLGEAPDESAYGDLFLFQLYPYASVFLGPEGMLGGEARDRIAGFWRVLGETPPAEPDHLALMLALQTRLGEHEEDTAVPEHRERWRHARKAFLWEHLLSWLPPYLARLAESAPPFYRRWGRLLSEALSEEAAELGEPDSLPLHLREAPPQADPREEGGKAFLDSLLAPVRSGLILTRADLTRASRATETGTRIGERRFILEALLAQDSTGTLGWMAEEARRQGQRLREVEPKAVVSFWVERAEATATLLVELASSSKAES